LRAAAVLVGQGDLGESLRTHQPVLDLVLQKLPVTLELALLAFGIALLIGIPASIVSAVTRGTRWDWAANVFALWGISMPNFWLGILLILLFSVQLGWLPARTRLWRCWLSTTTQFPTARACACALGCRARRVSTSQRAPRTEACHAQPAPRQPSQNSRSKSWLRNTESAQSGRAGCADRRGAMCRPLSRLEPGSRNALNPARYSSSILVACRGGATRPIRKTPQGHAGCTHE
jgi:hypothetical protein